MAAFEALILGHPKDAWKILTTDLEKDDANIHL
jgi:hypothetical protein